MNFIYFRLEIIGFLVVLGPINEAKDAEENYFANAKFFDLFFANLKYRGCLYSSIIFIIKIKCFRISSVDLSNLVLD